MKNNFYNSILALGMMYMIWNIWSKLNSRGPGRSIADAPPPMTRSDWNDFYVRASVFLIIGYLLLRSNTKNIGNIAGFVILSILWAIGSFFVSIGYFKLGFSSFFVPPLGILVLNYYFIYKS